MSTKTRYAQIVWDALWDVSHPVNGRVCKYVSVGEVAAKAKVADQTAKKHLMAFAETEHVASLEIDGRVYFRRRVVNGELS